MEGLFQSVVEVSIMASFLIVAVILVRACFKRASASFKCLLWMLVGIRLLVPVNISVPFSLVPNVELTVKQETIGAKEQGNLADAEQDNIVSEERGEILGNPLPDVSYQGNAPVYGNVSGESNVSQSVGRDETVSKDTATSKDAVNRSMADSAISMNSILAILWMCGTLVMLGFMIGSGLHLRNNLRMAIPDTVMFGEETIKVYRDEHIASPFLMGIILPKIYVPFDMKEQEMQFVLAHELTHIRRRDHLLKPLSFLVLSVYWFNPFVWVAFILLGRDIESACDERVMREIPTMDRAAYAQALLSCASNQRKIAICPVAFGESDVKKRVKNVLNYKKPGFWTLVGCVVLGIIVVFCFMTVSDDGPVEDVSSVTGTESSPSPKPTPEPPATPEPSTEPVVTSEPAQGPTPAPTTAPTIAPTPEPTPVPTIVPGDWVPAPLEGYTESQSAQIREELLKRIVYEADSSSNVLSVWLDSADYENGTILGTKFLPENSVFQSLDIVNNILPLDMDGKDWLAVTIKANLLAGDVLFPYDVMEIMIPVERAADGTIVLESYNKNYMKEYLSSEGTYYEDNNYIPAQINLLKADVTHDGIDDYIETYVYFAPETDMNTDIDELILKHVNNDAAYVKVYDGSTVTEADKGTLIWTKSYSGVHAGNGQVSVVYKDGLAYLLDSSIYGGQGFQSYVYKVYALDGEGRHYIIDAYTFDFYMPDYTQEEQKAFAASFKEALTPWMEGGQLIIGTEVALEEQMVTTERKQYSPQDFYDIFLNEE